MDLDTRNEFVKVAGVLRDAVQEQIPEWARSSCLSGLRGSMAHNTFIPDSHPNSTDDVDIFQVCVMPEDWYLGLDSWHRREGRNFSTDGERVDILVYEIQKFVYLLEKGNPNVHAWLWMQPDYYLGMNAAGEFLVQNRQGFLSKRIFDAVMGHATAQYKRMDRPGQFNGRMGEKRKAIVERFGYDIRAAAHCVRLLYQGIGLAATYRLKVNLTGAERDWVVSIKQGDWGLEEVQEHIHQLIDMFRDLELKSTLPKTVDRRWVNRVLITALEKHWSE
jgi:hypothetical protein